MFNGMMMDPELMRLAQEQMSLMSPVDIVHIQQQMKSNPELMRMASERMQNCLPEDFKQAAEQLKHISPEGMADMRERMAKTSPEELASMRSRMDAQVSYEISAAEMLKKQGNEFHSQGMYDKALQKYMHAKKNFREISNSKARNIVRACSLNMMSCYLKTNKYDECVKEGTEVLAYDPKNVKALYRRGQAYKELESLGDAVSDLSKALEVSPGDETIADLLRDAEEKLAKEGTGCLRRGLVIEEITDEETVSSGTKENVKSGPLPRETSESSTSQIGNPKETPIANSEYLDELRDKPESQNFMSNTNPETLAALNGGLIGDMPPEMIKMATGIMNKMSPEEKGKMFEMASSWRQKMRPSSGVSDLSGDDFPTIAQNMERNGSDAGESSSVQGLNFSPGFPSPTGDMQEHVRNQMKDLAMQLCCRKFVVYFITQMLSSMIKNMNPEMMASMSEQFGIKLSREDLEKAQQPMSSLTPESLDTTMKWVYRVQRVVEGAKKTKNWLLGRPGMILAIFMLLLAIFLRWLGFLATRDIYTVLYPV